MIKSEEAVVESGRRWMAGKVSDDEYFEKVHRSVIQTLGGGVADRLASLVVRLFSRI